MEFVLNHLLSLLVFDFVRTRPIPGFGVLVKLNYKQNKYVTKTVEQTGQNLRIESCESMCKSEQTFIFLVNRKIFMLVMLQTKREAFLLQDMWRGKITSDSRTPGCMQCRLIFSKTNYFGSPTPFLAMQSKCRFVIAPVINWWLRKKRKTIDAKSNVKSCGKKTEGKRAFDFHALVQEKNRGRE